MTRLGILGGGQLGRMMALAAHPLGITTTVLDPSAKPCAGDVCRHIRGEYDDHQALYQLVQASDVVTYEFENVPVETARWLAERVPVYPPPEALEVSQDRIVEKTFLNSLGTPTPPFADIKVRADLDAAVKDIGLPAVLKTRRFGYDGKGQMVLRTPADVDNAWTTLGGRPLIYEGFVKFDQELSIIVVRAVNGEVKSYPLVENVHREGILWRSLAPASSDLWPQAGQYADKIIKALNYVGVLAIEWFRVGNELYANEMAPRVHNSGHWTIEGAVTSQFENHVRAVCGLPLGETDTVGYSAMFNIISDAPDFRAILQSPKTHLHWYGKTPQPRRKLGHITMVGSTIEEREELIQHFENKPTDGVRG